MAKVRERLAVIKQAAQKSDGGRFNLRKLNDLQVRDSSRKSPSQRLPTIGYQTETCDEGVTSVSIISEKCQFIQDYRLIRVH